MQFVIHQLLQTGGELIEPLGLLLQPPLRILMVEPLLQQDEIVAGSGLLAVHRLQQLLLEMGEALGTGALIRRHQLGGRRRGRGAQVGGKVADGDIHLVAHRAHHRDGGVGDGARHRLFVEAPEIFERPAAASDDQHIHLGAAVGQGNGRDDLADGGAALHLGRVDKHRQIRRAAFEYGQHVVQGSAGGGGDEATARGSRGSGRLRPSSNSPSAPRRRLSSSKRSASAPSPAGCIDSMISW